MGTSPRQLSAMVVAVVTCAPLALLGAPVVAQVMAGLLGAAGMMAAAAADRRRADEPSVRVDVRPSLGGFAHELRRLDAPAQRDLDRIDRRAVRPRRPAVLTPTDCAVSAIDPLSAQVYVAPGPLTPETWPTISPTSSTGGRSDLVIVRVEDPNVPETGVWAEPADPRYAFVRVIEGVPRGTWNVAQVNSAWNAVTLARIDRPASTGCVRPAHITDLRTLTDLRTTDQPALGGFAQGGLYRDRDDQRRTSSPRPGWQVERETCEGQRFARVRHDGVLVGGGRNLDHLTDDEIVQQVVDKSAGDPAAQVLAGMAWAHDRYGKSGLIAEHKIEDGAFDTVEIRDWSTGRVVRRESTGR